MAESFKHKGLSVMDLNSNQFELMDQEQLRKASHSLAQLQRAVVAKAESLQAAMGAKVTEDRAKAMAARLSPQEREALQQVLSNAGGIPSEESVNGG